MYSQEHVESDIGRGLSQRHDAATNFVRTGGRYGRSNETKAVLAARTNYFREEYAYGQVPLIEGIEPYLFHEGFVEAARAVHGRRVIEPAIVFANLMVPGQEFGAHRRSRVPRLQPESDAAMASRRDAPLRLVRCLAHADRHRCGVVP